MKIPKSISLIALVFFLFLASGCSKSLLQQDHAKSFLIGTGDECRGDCTNAFLPQDGEGLPLDYHLSDRLQDVHFEFARYDLDEKLKTTLKNYVAYLKVHPEYKLEIQGYCDERGSNNYNISLGQRRAQAIKSYLVLQGIDRNRIQTISYGEEKPFCFENNEECWRQNRRARFLVAE